MNCKKTSSAFLILVFCVAFSMIFCSCGNKNVTNQKGQEAGIKEEVNAALQENDPENKNKPKTQNETSAQIQASDETQPEYTKHDIIPDHFAYAMTVQINPLVELYFDEEDVVVGISYLNQDAYDAYEKLDILGADLAASMEMLVTEAIDRGYMKEDATVQIEMSQVSDEVHEVNTTVLLKAQTATQETVSEKMGDATAVEVAIAVSEQVTEATGAAEPVICSDCNGTGNSCKECGGTGIVNCKRCNNGIESCGTCHGTAIIDCHGCHGAGKTGDAGETCNRCGGSGKQSCDACHGQGTFTCSWCNGALRHVCPECWGEGTCDACGGNGYINQSFSEF